jgi:hypothetical protein
MTRDATGNGRHQTAGGEGELLVGDVVGTGTTYSGPPMSDVDALHRVGMPRADRMEARRKVAPSAAVHPTADGSDSAVDLISG